MRISLATLVALTCLSTLSHAQTPSDAAPQSLSQAGAAPSANSDQTEEQTEDFWMRQKLEYSKAILQSLTSGEFKTLASEAEKMRRLSKLEGFVRRRNEGYRKQRFSGAGRT